MKLLKSHFVAALSGTAVSQLIAGIAQVLIVRALGVSQYGAYTLLYASLAIVSAIIGTGLDLWLLDYGSRVPTHIRTARRRIIAIKISLALGCGIFLVSGIFPQPIAPHLVILGLIAVSADSVSSSMWQSLRAINHHRNVALIQSGNMLLILGAVLAGAAHQIDTLLALQAGIAVCVCLVSWRISQRALPHADSTTPVSLNAGIPFVISDVCAQLYTYSGTLILAQVASLYDVGIYRGAWSIIGYSFVIPAVIFHTTLPQLNAARTVQTRQRIIVVASGLMLIYALGMWLAAQYVLVFLLPLLYGGSFQASAVLVPQLAMIPVLKACSFFGVLLLIQQQHLRIRIGVQISVVALLWVIAPLLIPTYGIVGAITTQLWCESVLAVGYLLTGVLGMRLVSPPATSPHHIYISNMHGVGNVGDLAIHQAQLAMLAHRYPQARMTLAYADLTSAQPRFPNHTVVHGLSHWVYDTHGRIAPLTTRIRRMCALALAIPLMRWGGQARLGLTRAEATTLNALATADLVCASGGGYLYDTPQRATLWRWLSWDCYLIADMLVAIWLGRPLVLLPQSFGPIHSRWLRWGVQYVSRHAQHVYARESWSSTWLTHHGIAHTMAADLAWRWANPRPPVHNTPPILGITAIDWGAQYAGFAGQHAYEQRLCAVMRHYVAHGWHIRLFVQSQDTNPAWDDAHVVHRLWAHMAHPAVQIIPFIAEPQALQHAYAQLDRLLTTRFHAAILRLACQLPCVVLSYLPKATATMHDLGLGAWCLDIADSDAATLIAALDSSAAQYAILGHLPIMATAFESAPSGYPSADPQ